MPTNHTKRTPVVVCILSYTNDVLFSATMFAKEMGFTVESLSTNKSKTEWKNWTNNNCQPNFRQVSEFHPS